MKPWALEVIQGRLLAPTLAYTILHDALTGPEHNPYAMVGQLEIGTTFFNLSLGG